jgi:hypothetical protein
MEFYNPEVAKSTRCLKTERTMLPRLGGLRQDVGARKATPAPAPAHVAPAWRARLGAAIHRRQTGRALARKFQIRSRRRGAWSRTSAIWLDVALQQCLPRYEEGMQPLTVLSRCCPQTFDGTVRNARTGHNKIGCTGRPKNKRRREEGRRIRIGIARFGTWRRHVRTGQRQ